eukprot:TRINITY_DN1157_c0_g1_i2.p3 TRINITY_DN1157_c0_g1~~TRINITY_DN1157_c0_g1_i2.p3  ORF type:complete len:115 (-),score=0.56 TRINITY_DN1157_c0_g1_i2:734-1078(-)
MLHNHNACPLHTRAISVPSAPALYESPDSITTGTFLCHSMSRSTCCNNIVPIPSSLLALCRPHADLEGFSDHEHLYTRCSPAAISPCTTKSVRYAPNMTHAPNVHDAMSHASQA